MGGSVLAALLIISIGEWGGDEALHCAAERNFTLLSGKLWEEEKIHSGAKKKCVCLNTVLALVALL